MIRPDMRVRISAHESNPWNGATGTVVAVSEYGAAWWVVTLDDRPAPFASVVVHQDQLSKVD